MPGVQQWLYHCGKALQQKDAMEFAQRLKQLRTAAAKSRESLAQETGLSRGTIQDYEQGKRKPTLESAFKLAKALGVTLEAFMTHEGRITVHVISNVVLQVVSDKRSDVDHVQKLMERNGYTVKAVAIPGFTKSRHGKPHYKLRVSKAGSTQIDLEKVLDGDAEIRLRRSQR